MNTKIDKNKVAIVMLAFADFEALEISLAAYSKFLKGKTQLYILQNGRGNYDCERTYKVALRYQNLFPKNIKVVDWIKPDVPYNSIKTLLNSEEMTSFDYICKVDDDVFPITEDWLDKLIKCYENSAEKYGEDLAYVTPLVNNNPWGFKETLNIFNLENEYFEKYGREHIVGSKFEFEPQKLIPANEIYPGWAGTVWRNPHISRWLHENTTFNPEKFIELTKNQGYKEANSNQRYSINCILFKKELWNTIEDGTDDEMGFFNYCRTQNKKIIADLSNPFIHQFFFTQRDENKDLIPKIRKVYEEFLNLPYPISLCPIKEYENENRLRFIEKTYLKAKNTNFYKKIINIKNSPDRKHKIIYLFGKTYVIKRRK